jgi:hypothetical protein
MEIGFSDGIKEILSKWGFSNASIEDLVEISSK